jgi:DNA-binding CsgD family transcriptional regulator
VRAAIEWAADSDPCAGIAMFAATRDLFQMLGQADGRRIADTLLARCPTRDTSRVEVLITAGILAMASANGDAAQRLQHEAREIASSLHDLELEGYASLYQCALPPRGRMLPAVPRHDAAAVRTDRPGRPPRRARSGSRAAHHRGAWAVRVRVGGDIPPLFRKLLLEPVRSACEAALGDSAERTWAEGMRLDLDDVIALASGSRRPRLSATSGLSARELDVVRLVANGLANKAIAAQLHLSVRTVESHVRHALVKARLDNRTQLAAWAHEHIQ